MRNTFSCSHNGAKTEVRLAMLALLMACGLLTLLIKLWIEQVHRHAFWNSRIATASEVTVRVPPIRGDIRDRNGVVLVTNRVTYGVDFRLSEMVRDYRAQYGWVPKSHFRAPERQMLTEKSEADIVQIVNTHVIPRLQDLNLATDYNAERLQKHYRNDTEIPFHYRDELDFATVARFAEHAQPGVEVSPRPVRSYVYGALAAHLLGYVGAPVDISALPDVRDFSFYEPDLEGKSQLERSLDPYLRGTPGVRVLQRNAKGLIESEIRSQPPKNGSHVYLTLDARIQTIAEEALRHPALGRAATVVLDPRNGDILAMASVPSFDPNSFIPGIAPGDWKKLLDDPAIPLVNRAVSGFPPGSTFKIVTALAGLRKKLGAAQFNCPGGIQYGDHYFHCWIADKHSTHGVLGLSDALKVSCDCFFYQYGNAAGIDSIDRIGSLMGLGKTYEIGLSDEKSGCLPGPEWMRTRGAAEKWTSAHTANVSIGQGYVLASPLQMAIAYAAVANGGIVFEPRLIRTALTPEGTLLLNDDGEPALPDVPKIRADLRRELSADQIAYVRKGLWEVVNEDGGTGAKGRIEGATVAGKTGTAQATDRGRSSYIAWFCAFAPYEAPRYVVVTMVQGGNHGGSVAAPIASRILERCIALDAGRLKVDLQPLKPAHGAHPFQSIEALQYESAARAPLLVATPDNREEAAERREPARANPQLARSRAQPDLRSEPDAGGRVKQTVSRPKARPRFRPTAESAPVERNVPTRSVAPTAPYPAPERRGFFQRFFAPR